MNELMIHVEKAVRPIRASLETRLKMREELLAHLQGIYEEELEQSEDPDAAVRAAIGRFGSANDVSRNLQASVPWSSLFVWYFYRGFSSDRTRPATVTDATWWMMRRMAALWLVVGLPWVGIRVWLGDLLPGEAICFWSVFLLYGFAIAWPLCVFLAANHGILGQQASSRRTLLFAIASWGAYMTLPLSFWALPWFGETVRESWLGKDTKLALLAAVFAVLPAGLAMFARTKTCRQSLQGDEERAQRAREWDLLELSTD